jgi:tetratricopeptide (TPR) repeat protein
VRKLWLLSLITLVSIFMPGPAESAETNEFAAMQKLLSTSPKAAQQLEREGKPEEAGKLYEQLALKVQAVETMPRKIFTPHAFGLYAQFLERQGQKKEAMQWYEKILQAPVNAHANTVKAENLKRYAALLRADGDKAKAAKVEIEARELIEIHKQLNRSGADY